MKPIFLFLFVVSIFSVSAQQINFDEEKFSEEEEVVEEPVFAVSSLNWLTDLNEAKELAVKENKKILLFFTGSDWCAPCLALKDDFFNTPKFEESSEKFILLLIDYPRRKDILTADQLTYNRTIIDKFNKNKSFPKVVILNKNGKELGKISGYSSFNSYKDTSHHEKFIAKYL